MKVLETPNGTQRRTGNPCLQHSSGLLQAVCAHIRAVPASLKFTQGCWGARCSGGHTLHRWPVSPAWPWGCCSSLQLLPLTNTTYRLLLWIIPVPPARWPSMVGSGSTSQLFSPFFFSPFLKTWHLQATSSRVQAKSGSIKQRETENSNYSTRSGTKLPPLAPEVPE